VGEGSAIEWTDHTFNPWVGCEKVSPGCAHCYAETLVTGRMNRPGTWGADGVRQRTSASTWALPLRWERAADRFLETHGRRQRVFVASLADVFEPRPELVPWRADLFDLIEECPSLDWLLLTKRPEVARDVLAVWNERHRATRGPLPNLWLGTSIENSRHTYRAAVLREIPAAVRFISAEPLLGSLFESESPRARIRALVNAAEAAERSRPEPVTKKPLDLTGIDWVIVGGESGGRSSRPMRVEWAREIRDACVGNRGLVPIDEPLPSRPAFLFKQWGSHDSEGRYVGASPKSGGRLLDGVEWTEFPTPGADAARPGQQTLLDASTP
jgi:protein gp37